MHRSVVEVYVGAVSGLDMHKFPPAESAPVGRESVGQHLLVESEGGVVVGQQVKTTRGLPQKRICIVTMTAVSIRMN